MRCPLVTSSCPVLYDRILVPGIVTVIRQVPVQHRHEMRQEALPFCLIVTRIASSEAVQTAYIPASFACQGTEDAPIQQWSKRLYQKQTKLSPSILDVGKCPAGCLQHAHHSPWTALLLPVLPPPRGKGNQLTHCMPPVWEKCPLHPTWNRRLNRSCIFVNQSAGRQLQPHCPQGVAV